MIDHYNAFISYKHAPEDNKVAEAVHKGLERFHIPHKIRKKNGIKRISRIFRDKDELPITSDLSDSISNALANSDYLIVICSTNTKESMWVPREIEYFLKNHSKRDIFTVLVNGEPYDVIPDILKFEDCVVKDEDGTERTVSIPMEPLSCDFRMPLRKAKKTELPRLASGIVGCAYDELMNRRRQYRLKQLMAVVSLAVAILVAFCGYMYYSRDKIHKNYLESLRNQSRYLANESENLLEKEQRITALQLALEALPQGEEDDRPITAEAVKALNDATLAYESSNGNNINAAWNYPMPGMVSEFRISRDGGKIAIRDEGDVVGIWNTEDHKRILYKDDLEQQISGMSFPDEKTFVIWDKESIRGYDADDGTELWANPAGEDVFLTSENLMVSGSAFYIGTLDRKYLKIDTRSGKVESRITPQDDPDLADLSMTVSKLSPNGKMIAFCGIGGWGKYSYGVADVSTGKMQIADYTEEYVKDVEWIDNDTFAVASTIADMSGSMSFGDSQLISTDHSTIRCLNAADMSEKWVSDFICNGVTINSGFFNLSKDTIAYFSGNVVTVYDSATGEMKYSNNVNDSVIDVSDKDGDGFGAYITASGGYAIPNPDTDEDAVYYNRYFTDELRQAVVSNGVYVRQRYGHEVIYYGVHVYDEEWTPLYEDASLEGSALASCLDENCLVLLTTDYEDAYVEIYGLDANARYFKTKLEGEGNFRFKLLGVYKDKAYIGYNNDDHYDIRSISIDSQKIDTAESFVTATTFDDALTMKDGKFIYTVRDEDLKNSLVVQDIETGKKQEIPIPEEVGFIKAPPAWYGQEGTVCLRSDKDYIIDIGRGETIEIKTPENWTEPCCYSDNSLNGLIAISDGKKILLTDKEGQVSSTIRCPGVTPLGMTFWGNELDVLYSDGAFFRYVPQTGQFLMNIDATVYHGYDDAVSFEYDEENELVYIRMEDLTDIIDIKSGVEIAHILNCFGHHKGRDIFITTSKESGENPKVGYYRRYSVNDLITKADDILKGAKLSEELRYRYGLEVDEEEDGNDTGGNKWEIF